MVGLPMSELMPELPRRPRGAPVSDPLPPLELARRRAERLARAVSRRDLRSSFGFSDSRYSCSMKWISGGIGFRCMTE